MIELSHWQKTKLKHAEGKRKQELEEHFGLSKNRKQETEKLKKKVKQLDSLEKKEKPKKKSK